MTVHEITAQLEKIAPLPYAEDFDNVGLLVGNPKMAVSKALIALDTLETVVDEAIEKGCSLIISFHPIIFSGLKKLNGKNYVERAVIKAIKNDIAIYAIHTALDNSIFGVNDRICEQLKLVDRNILIPKTGVIKKLATYVPKDQAKKVRNALFEAGAGNIGNYDHCSFNSEGVGSYRGNEESNPTIGEKGKLHLEAETQISVTYQQRLEGNILKALFKSHPYEEVAYEVYSLDNEHQKIGMGMIGELTSPMTELEFLHHVKKSMSTKLVRHTPWIGKNIKKVAVLGGSGSFAIGQAIAAGADAFVTADMKYHDFYKAEGKLLIADIGHYESEQFTKNLLVEYLTEKIPSFAFLLSEVNTNPVKYL